MTCQLGGREKTAVAATRTLQRETSKKKKKEKRSNTQTRDTTRTTEGTFSVAYSRSFPIIADQSKHIIIITTMRSSTAYCCTTIVIFLASCCMMLTSVSGFGGSNVFGLFRRRRLRLLDEQMEREDQAARKGFAGPHGEPLSGDEVVVDENQLLGVLDPFLGWFRNTPQDSQ